MRQIRTSPWEKWGKKLRGKIVSPRFVGFFLPEDTRGMRLVIGREKALCLYWLVDPSDGVICDALFQAYGPPLLLAAGEIASELVLRKNYDQASRITTDLLDQQVREQRAIPAFPHEGFSFLNQALSAIDRAVQQCLDLPFESTYDKTPIESNLAGASGIPGWEDLSAEQQKKIIEEVIDLEIRPYIELDAGGISIVGLHGYEVWIAYEGSCTTCHSSTGSTLSAIQHILQSRVSPHLTVVPQM